MLEHNYACDGCSLKIVVQPLLAQAARVKHESERARQWEAAGARIRCPSCGFLLLPFRVKA